MATSLLAALLVSGLAHAAIPTGWQSFEAIGLRFAAPPTVEVLAQDDDMLVLGEPDWERYARDFDFDRPTGMLIEIGIDSMANLRALEEGEEFTRLDAPAVIGAKTFDVYVAADVMDTGEGPLERHARILLSCTAVEGGDHVVISITLTDATRDEADERIGAVAATFEAIDPATFTDDVPVTHGLAGALELTIPAGMHRNWDRADVFRIQSWHDLGRSNLQVKLGDTTPSGSRSAETELRLTLEQLTPDATIDRATVVGEPAWRIEDVDLDGRRIVTVVFERCFPDDTLVLLQLHETPEWRAEHGPLEAVLDTLTLTFPDGSAACTERHIAPIEDVEETTARVG